MSEGTDKAEPPPAGPNAGDTDAGDTDARDKGAGDTDTSHAYDVFISHADEDRDWVEGYLIDALTQAGVRCYHEAAFELGSPRILAFEEAVQQSRRTLLILSAAYFASPFGQFTDLLAETFGLESRTWPVIPVRLEDVDLPPRLMLLQGLDATTPEEWEDAVERLCTELQRPLPGPAPAPPCPYPGMAPFSEAESERFFGREEEVEEMLQLLRVHPFLAVIGPSGSGKSSLVTAGFLPDLRISPVFGAGEWLVRTLRPTAAPMAALSAALAGDATHPGAAVAALLERHPGSSRLLLFVDQLEEVFTVATEGATEFQEALAELVESGACHVVATARADFYPQLMAAPLWPQISRHRLEVLPLEGKRLRPAIVRPAESVGVFVETGLVERLVADAAREPGALPLVQETMVCLWERLERRLLPLSAYEAIVLPYEAYKGASRTGLQIAMARRADAAMDSLSPAQQTIARRILLRLVQFGEGRSDVRRQQLVSDLEAGTDDPGPDDPGPDDPGPDDPGPDDPGPDDPGPDDAGEFEKVLEHLVERRLLTLTAGDGELGRRADLAHEALIVGWPTLQVWLTERRDGEQTRRRLLEKAREWIRLGRGDGGLLDEVEMLEAQRWLASEDAPDLGVDLQIVELTAASRRATEERQRQDEAARQRELDHANSLAAEQEARARAERERADDQTRSAHALRRMVAALAVLSLVMVAVAGFATVQRRRADRESRYAGSRQLAAVSRTEPRLDVALLLAEEAYRRAPTVEARGSLLAGLEHNPRLVRFLQGHEERAGPGAFSPDGKMVAAAGDDDRVILWDVPSGRERARLAHRGDVRAMAFSADSDFLAAGGADTLVTLWDLRTGKPAGPGFTGHTDGINTLAFRPHTGMMASAADGTILLWDLASRQVLARLDQGSPVNSVVFTPDGMRLAAASDDGRVVVWDVGSGDRLFDVGGHSDLARALAISPSGDLLASAGNDRAVVLWDMRSFAQVGDPLLGHAERVFGVAFSPDGRTLASASRDHTVILWDVESRQALDRPLTGHADAVRSVAFSPDGRTLVTASEDTTVALWQLDAGPRLATPVPANGEAVLAIAASPDGRLLASGGLDGTVMLWDPTTREQVGDTLRGAQDGIYGLAFSPDGELVAAASADGSVQIWETRTQARRHRVVPDGGEAVWALAWSPDGSTLVTGGAGRTIRFWDVAEGTARGEPIVGSGHWLALAFAPRGRQVVAAGTDGRLTLWALDPGYENDGDGTLLRDGGRPVQSVAFSPDGRRLAAGSSDATVTMWDMSGRPRLLRSMPGHALGVRSVAFSPDGHTLVSGADDGAVVLWDVPTGQRVGDALMGHDGAVESVAFAPDGRTVFSGGVDRHVILWDVALDSWRARACQVAGRNLRAIEWQQLGGRGGATGDVSSRQLNGRRLTVGVGAVLALVAAGAGCRETASPGTAESVAVSIVQGIPYASAAELDVYLPEGGRDLPVIVTLHGCCGSRDDLSQLAFGLAEKGAVVFNASWRGTDSEPGGYPGAYREAACAVGFARATAADHGGDPRRVTLVGWSDGALVAGVVANAGDDFAQECQAGPSGPGSLPDALVTLGGFLGWAPGGNGHVDAPYVSERTVSFFGGTPEVVPDAWVGGNPYTHLGRNRALQVRLVVGAEDPLLVDGQCFSRAAQAAGHPVSLTVAEGAGHQTIIAPRTPEGALAVREILLAARGQPPSEPLAPSDPLAPPGGTCPGTGGSR